MPWQESWIAPGQHGARKAHGTEDVFWTLALKLEAAVLEGRPLYGFTLDYAKCFDRVPREIMFRLAEANGLHAQVLGPLRAMYAGLRSRFRCAGAVGKEFSSTNGILQGCPLSVILLNGLVAIWCRTVTNEVPEAEPTAYVDDTSVTSSRPMWLQQALDVTNDFATATGMQLHASKCKSFSTATTKMKKLKLGPQTLNQALAIGCLGAILRTHEEAHVDTDVRVASAQKVTRRLQGVPLPFKLRALLLDALVMPRALYACEVSRLSPQRLASLNVDVVKMLLGGRRGRHCSEIVFTLLCPGHRLNAKSACIYRRLVTLKQILDKRPDLRTAFLTAWRPPGCAQTQVVGPVGLASEAFSQIGWRWDGPFDVKTRGGEQLSILDVDLGYWQHAVRQSLRESSWRAAAGRRSNLQGIECGVARDATMALLEGGRLGPHRGDMLRTILADGVWTQERKQRANMVASAVCVHCGEGEVEDHMHMWWRCAAWAPIRAEYPKATSALHSRAPACLGKCGLVPEGWEPACVEEVQKEDAPELLTKTRAMEVIDLTLDEEAPEEYAEAARRYGETWVQGRVVVYTDGAARDNQFRALCRAGVGAFWSEGHPFNVSQQLQGPVQTNNRAELVAVIRVMEIELRPLEVRTDSAYVQNGFHKYMRDWKRNGWQKKGRPICNSDLWRRLDDVSHGRPAGSIKMTKVKGHATAQDVQNGTVSRADRAGNAWADALAVSGAISSASARGSQEVARVGIEVQKMMLDIFAARQRALQAASASDTGSPAANARRETSSSGSSTDSSSTSSSASSNSSGAAPRRRPRRRHGRSAPQAPD